MCHYLTPYRISTTSVISMWNPHINLRIISIFLTKFIYACNGLTEIILWLLQSDIWFNLCSSTMYLVFTVLHYCASSSQRANTQLLLFQQFFHSNKEIIKAGDSHRKYHQFRKCLHITIPPCTLYILLTIWFDGKQWSLRCYHLVIPLQKILSARELPLQTITNVKHL